MSEKVEKEVQLIASGVMRIGDGGKTLELLQWHGEAAVLVDGKWLVRRTMLVDLFRDAELGALIPEEAKRHG